MPPIVAHPDSRMLLAAPYCCSARMATYRKWGDAVDITNLLSHTPSQFIEADAEIDMLALAATLSWCRIQAIQLFGGLRERGWRIVSLETEG